MPLIELAPNLWQLPLMPLDFVNVYLVGDVVVDSGPSFTRRRLLAALEGRHLTAHVLTHAHPDHLGGSHALCSRRGVPLCCGADDRAEVERSVVSLAAPSEPGSAAQSSGGVPAPAEPVVQSLREGDTVAGFEVIETPGHTAGHIALWRAEDRVVILGDVAFHRDPLTLRTGLREPFRVFTADPAGNRRSARRIADLHPDLICFGHGAPLRDGERFARWAAGLAGD